MIRKHVRAGEKVLLKLSHRERELILEHTFADDELTASMRITPASNKASVYSFTLDDLEELSGYVGAEANHAKDKKLQRELDRLFERMQAVLESYTDEDGQNDRVTGDRIEHHVPKLRKNHIREERIHNEVIVDASGPEEQALGWYYYLENKIQFPFSARCISSKVVSPLRKGETVEVRSLAPEDSCADDMLVLIRWPNRNVAVPLAQLAAIDADESTVEAIGDWHYWLAQGYCF